MTSNINPQDITGAEVVGSDGDKIGKVEQVYLDDTSGAPQWVTVKTGMFGGKQSFAPLEGADFDSGSLRLAVTKDAVKDAPRVDEDGHLEPDEEQQLFTHYSQWLGGGQTSQQVSDQPTTTTQTSDTDRRDMSGEAGVVGQDTSGPTTDEAMTRSEEQLHVGTEKAQGGKARLRKYVTTEQVSQTVPVSHEEAHLEREPITDANRGDAMSGGDITEEEHEVDLTAERPVVSKETVPVERVKLTKETVTEQHQVDETVRKEQIDDIDVDNETHTQR